jgi:segregation and condensation protein B
MKPLLHQAMSNIEAKIESVLLYKNEPVSIREMAKLIGEKEDEVKEALNNLQNFYKDRGVVIVTDGETYSFGSNPSQSSLIEEIQKDELSRELGRAGVETLAIILYRGPLSRREIDYIRGVNSGFILRNLMIRGLIERTESATGERSFTYKPTLKLMEYLGVTRREDLPEFEIAFAKIEEFRQNETTDEQDA